MTAPALYVQVDDDQDGIDEPTHHKVDQVYRADSTPFDPPPTRKVDTVCGQSVTVADDRISEARTEPGGHRCPKCFGKGK